MKYIETFIIKHLKLNICYNRYITLNYFEKSDEEIIKSKLSFYSKLVSKNEKSES